MVLMVKKDNKLGILEVRIKAIEIKIMGQLTTPNFVPKCHILKSEHATPEIIILYSSLCSFCRENIMANINARLVVMLS
jgi:hypothetical protein